MIPYCTPQFGKLPNGARLERIRQSPNYADGEFKNLEPTKHFAEGSSFFSAGWDFLFKTWERQRPEAPLPMLKTDLKTLDRNIDLIIWLGHSAAFLQLGGKRILIEPVFSSSAAPFSSFNKDYNSEYPYSADDIPDIDYLLISHDHWDHLDYPSILALKDRVGAIVCPLGVGSHLEYWGVDPAVIHEGDWNDAFQLAPNFTVHILPARHFSGRWLSRNKTLWASFMLETPERRVFYSGDTGYGKHFAEIGKRFGGIDLAIMENGQYNIQWHHAHMLPEETALAAAELGAKAVLPVHSGRFVLAHHAWDEPYIKLTEASKSKPFELLTPAIGQVVYLDGREQTFEPWWESVTIEAQNSEK
ncbi:MAG: MBL fold metallo-hydrolase [Proteobacteria bacterium]|nr:MBL fold metallo-hydrolase [Pseudomonadota bacterium]